MHETSDLESYGKGHRTFDCPWCGAISGIDPSHIGEHFDCPECHKATKLTAANTRPTELTEPPPGAPHHAERGGHHPAHEVSELESYGKGHRTFDCPWCGAISGIDPSHIGEHFDCPECHKQTKLTPDNTRSAHVTEPPPDAPHHEEKSSKAGLLLVAVVAVVAGIVAVISTTGGGDEGAGDGPDVGRAPPADVAPAEQPPTQPPPPEEQPPGETQPPDGQPPEEMPPDGQPPEEQPAEEVPPEEAPPGEEQPVDPPAATDPVEAARIDVDRARQALADWEAAHPEVVEKLGLLKACTDVRSEAARLCESYPGPDATQEEARAYNAVMREFVAADPKRIEAATRIVAELNSERLKPRFIPSWESVNFYLPYVRETMGRLEAAGQCVESEEYGALLRAVREAEVALEQATAN